MPNETKGAFYQAGLIAERISAMSVSPKHMIHSDGRKWSGEHVKQCACVGSGRRIGLFPAEEVETPGPNSASGAEE